MKWVACVICLLAVILPFTHALVGAFTEAQGKLIPNKHFYPIWILTTLAIIGLMALMPKCKTHENSAPSGQTDMEHYEPRY